MFNKVFLIVSILLLMACGESLENKTYQDAKLAFEAKQYKKSFKYSDHLAKKGDANALNLLGIHYNNGFGVSKDEVKGQTLILNAAEQGYSAAMFNIGLIEERKGQVKTQVSKLAIDWYLKAAEQDYVNAQVRLGFLYRDGLGLKQDHKAAVSWFKKAGHQKNIEAQVALAWLYVTENSSVLDYKKAFYWAKKGLENNSGEAAFIAAQLSEKGLGITQNFDDAVIYYEKAIEQGNVAANYYLGKMLINHTIADKSPELGIAYLEQGAKFNDANAQLLLGTFYQNGTYVPLNLDAANDLYKRACNNNNKNACNYFQRLTANIELEKRMKQNIIDAFSQKPPTQPASSSTLSSSRTSTNDTSCSVTGYGKGHRAYCGAKAKTCIKTGYGVGNHIACGGLAKSCEKTGYGVGNRVACGGLAKSCEKTGYGVGNDIACGGLAKSCEKTGYGVGNDIACGGLAKSCEKTGYGKGNRVACGGLATTCDKTGYGKGNHAACGGRSDDCISTGSDGYKVCGPLAKR